jgi:hypothetical protein
MKNYLEDWNFYFGDFYFDFFHLFRNNWYKESIKSKSELRQDILNEIAGEGKKSIDENK